MTVYIHEHPRVESIPIYVNLLQNIEELYMIKPDHDEIAWTSAVWGGAPTSIYGYYNHECYS